MKYKTKIKYHCHWCEYEFEQSTGSYGQGHKRVSSQVKCPRCTNFIPTTS